jgi:hypothetical protein
MKTYLRDNNSKVNRVINQMVDTHNLTNKVNKAEWKSEILNPYIQFLSNLEIVKKYSWIETNSALKQHCDFIEKITTLCEASDVNQLPSGKFNKHLNEMINDWLDKNLQSELTQLEKAFYTRIVWQDEPLENDEKKDTPLQKKKVEALGLMNKKRLVNFM